MYFQVQFIKYFCSEDVKLRIVSVLQLKGLYFKLNYKLDSDIFDRFFGKQKHYHQIYK